eukprot:Polyplicarium_translucidae@DN3166_c0_g1_i1.p1
MLHTSFFNLSLLPRCFLFFLGLRICGASRGEGETVFGIRVERLGGQPHEHIKENHRRFSSGEARHVAYRGEGPFGSLGVSDSVHKGRRPADHQTPLEAFVGVVPVSHLRDSQYVAEIGIGTPPQLVHALFDTGSANMWVVDESCPDESCAAVRRFSPTKSATFRDPDHPKKLSIRFGTGSISGVTGVDSFSVGPFRIRDQSFGLVRREYGDSGSEKIFDHIAFEALFGCAFPVMSSTGPSIIDNLFEQNNITNPTIAFYTSNSTEPDVLPASALHFGGVDSSRFVPPMRFAPVAREHYWEVRLLSLEVGERRLCCDGEPDSYVIFDSGTSYNTIPSDQFAEFLDLIPSRTCKGGAADVVHLYPDIVYVLEGGVTIRLTPSMYLLTDPLEDPLECRAALMQLDVPSKFGHAYVLGNLPYMRHFYTAFRRGKGGAPSEVGVALAVHS